MVQTWKRVQKVGDNRDGVASSLFARLRTDNPNLIRSVVGVYEQLHSDHQEGAEHLLVHHRIGDAQIEVQPIEQARSCAVCDILVHKTGGDEHVRL